MLSVRIVLLIASWLLTGLGIAAAEPADCSAQLKRQDQQCQVLAEKLAAACPSGTNIKETAQCRDLSTQIANACTRKPCAPPPRKKAKAKSKSATGKGTGMGSGMGAGMGETRSKPAQKPAPQPK